MSEVEQLKVQIDKLSRQERLQLAESILESLEPGEDEITTAWEVEVSRRVEEILSGKVQGKRADELFAELRAQYP